MGETRDHMQYSAIVGILNVTPDSFSDGGQYSTIESAVARAVEMVQNGASVIDIGAESTRPGATLIHHQEEWDRLKDILPELKASIGERAKISLDSYHAATIAQALPYIDIINDVTGLNDPEIISMAKDKQIPVIVVHSMSIPADIAITIPINSNPIDYIKTWAMRKIESLVDMGIKAQNIILDPGIGFGKQYKQSLYILRHIDILQELCQSLGCKILVGHSRKGFLKSFNHASIEEKDTNTALISLYLSSKKVDYIRVHNVELHNTWFKNITQFFNICL